MVSRAARVFFPAALSFLFAVAVVAKNLPAYKVGDTVAENITAPVAFTVVDHEQTEVFRRQTAARVPAILRFDPQAVNDAVATFQHAFDDARTKFLDALHQQFPDRQFDDAALATDELQMFVGEYAVAQTFPASKELLAAWAKGETGAAVAEALAKKLREIMVQYIRPNTLPTNWLSSSRVKILAGDSTLDLARAQLHPLGRTRTNLMVQFPADAALGKFLAGFVRPNCALEIELTQASREQETANILAADHFDAGQIIAKRGEVVTAKIKAALDELRAHTPVAPRPVVAQPAPPEPERWPWVVAGFAVLALGAWLFWQRRGTSTLEVATTGDWRLRALEAERRAERATAIIRAEMVSHLAKNLTNDLVKQLVAQRNDLLDGHEMASVEMTALADRLEKLESGPSRKFYEQRIAELERELATKSAENRALIQSKIDAARRQLEETKSRVTLN